MQLHTDIAERDPGIRQRQPTDAGLDYVLPKTYDERVGLVRLKLGGVAGERSLEL